MTEEFFPERPEYHPTIYAYSDARYPGCLKVGYTARDYVKRIADQYPIKTPDKSYRIELHEGAVRADGSTFTDHEVHRVLERMGVTRLKGEWFRCGVDQVNAAIFAVKTRTENVEARCDSFGPRPEQQEAIERTAAYFEATRGDSQPSKFLWNAKMRFGKTFAAYQLAKRMNFKRVLVLTFKPAVQSAWRDDLARHVDFEGWQFIARKPDDPCDTIDKQYERAKKTHPIVCFGSFQDFLGVDSKSGGIKVKNEWVHALHWDLVIFDEYHFGAWRDSAKKLFEDVDEDAYYEKELGDVVDVKSDVRADLLDESYLPITARFYLYLSGTPFRALNSGEFIEEQIFNWTYSDEQRAKSEWSSSAPNPYAALPKLTLMTYQIPDSIRKIAQNGEFNEFDLNLFFSTKKEKGKEEDAQFVYKDYVQKWLDLIRGAYVEDLEDDLKLGRHKAPHPFSDARLLNILTHTLWFMPNVASCYAMKNLLDEKQNVFYHDYKVVVCAGKKAGVGLEALKPVVRSMDDPTRTKTIVLSCGKLTTGVTVKPWSGIFMLRNLQSPETYFQAAFRVQSPWEIDGDNGEKEIVKHVCYVFDFALDRALKQVADYSCQLNTSAVSPENKVGEFIKFLPVLAYDGATMRQVDAKDILDLAMSGTSATMLAKRWESALLVNVDNETLARLLANEDALRALEKVEGFRNLNEDIQTIINKSEHVKKAKKEEGEKTRKELKELSDEEKKYKSMRKEIQEKLIKLATRIPIFMYLSDYREQCLMDVIVNIEPMLFEKVTGLKVSDFELLCNLGVFNSELMNDAVYKFKRYEDSSLCYAGVDMYEDDQAVGGFDSVCSAGEFRRLYALQQASLR